MSNRLSRNCPEGQMCMECQNIAEGYDDRRSGTFDNFLFAASVFAPQGSVITFAKQNGSKFPI